MGKTSPYIHQSISLSEIQDNLFIFARNRLLHKTNERERERVTMFEKLKVIRNKWQHQDEKDLCVHTHLSGAWCSRILLPNLWIILVNQTIFQRADLEYVVRYMPFFTSLINWCFFQIRVKLGAPKPYFLIYQQYL